MSRLDRRARPQGRRKSDTKRAAAQRALWVAVATAVASVVAQTYATGGCLPAAPVALGG